MKIPALILSLLFSGVVLCQTTTVKFDKRTLKFDPVLEGTPMAFEFVVTNTGDIPLVFEKAEVTCTCTVVDLPPPVLPGATASIPVTFDTKGKLGWQYRKIKLQGNTKRPPEVVEFRVRVDAVE